MSDIHPGLSPATVAALRNPPAGPGPANRRLWPVDTRESLYYHTIPGTTRSPQGRLYEVTNHLTDSADPVRLGHVRRVGDDVTWYATPILPDFAPEATEGTEGTGQAADPLWFGPFRSRHDAGGFLLGLVAGVALAALESRPVAEPGRLPLPVTAVLRGAVPDPEAMAAAESRMADTVQLAWEEMLGADVIDGIGCTLYGEGVDGLGGNAVLGVFETPSGCRVAVLDESSRGVLLVCGLCECEAPAGDGPVTEARVLAWHEEVAA